MDPARSTLIMIKRILIISFAVFLLSSCKTNSPKEPITTPKEIIPAISEEGKSLYKKYKNQIAKLKQQAHEVEADAFYSNQYNEALERESDMDEAYAKADENLLNKMGEKSLVLLADSIKKTKDNKDKLDFLKEGIEKELTKSTSEQDYLANSEILQFINEEYFKGAKAYKEKSIEKALESYSSAYYASQRINGDNLAIKQIKDINKQLQNQLSVLEKVSSLKVADNYNKSIVPSEWQGRDYLENKDLITEIEALSADIMREQSQSPKSIKELLERARNAWKLAVLFNNQNKPDLAKEQLILSRQYSNSYADYALLGSYTVKSNQIPRDTLWKISKIYYKDPFTWPLLWMRNRLLIRDPDLIYPGWNLMIPVLPSKSQKEE